jgi:RNA polymerase sigma factor (sigma-70 family)
MRQLSERERQVVKQLYWDERTEAEIAHELGISQQAVSKIKRKAIQKLRELLEGLL